MKNFESGKNQVLVTCKMVQKGADLPSLLLGIDLQPTPSRGLQRQKVGRFTRMSEGKQEAVFLDMVGNHRVFPNGNIYENIDWNFNSTKYNKKPSGETQDQYCPLCYAYIPETTTICPDCGAEKIKKKKKPKPEKHLDGDLVEIVPMAERTGEDKAEVQTAINKALVDNDIEALIKVGRTITNGGKLPFWIYHKLNDKQGIVNIPLLYRIQRSLDYKSSWVYFAKKQIKTV